MIKQGIAFAGSAGDPRQEQQLFGFVMIAKMGSRVAAVSGVSKDPLVSSCFGSVLENVWPRFFSTLQFRNWTPPPGAGLSQKIVGVWESFGSSIGGGAVVRYVFTAAGRYAEAGTMQRYMALSRYETAIWTSRTFGDGSYTIRGNELVLTPDSGQPEVSRVRLEQSSQDGGRTWVEKLFLLKASMTSGNCSQFRCSNDDIELALERRDP
jgi:hypothetical protein